MGQELEEIKNENKLMKKDVKVDNFSNEKFTKQVIEIVVKEKAKYFELNKIQNGYKEITLKLMGYPLQILMY